MASSPGFGYIFVGQPQVAQFQQLGQRFFISYLPKTIPEKLEDQQVCLWLGPGVYRKYTNAENLITQSTRFLEARNDGVSYLARSWNYFLWFPVCSAPSSKKNCISLALACAQDSLQD
jgi:hypothetical protein